MVFCTTLAHGNEDVGVSVSQDNSLNTGSLTTRSTAESDLVNSFHVSPPCSVGLPTDATVRCPVESEAVKPPTNRLSVHRTKCSSSDWPKSGTCCNGYKLYEAILSSPSPFRGVEIPEGEKRNPEHHPLPVDFLHRCSFSSHSNNWGDVISRATTTSRTVWLFRNGVTLLRYQWQYS